MIKHLLFIAAGLSMFHAASAQKYVDASTLTIIGRTCPMEGHPYYRVDTTRYRFDNATIRHYCGYPAGVAVLFTTDSRRIEARWTTAPRNYGWNMTPVLQRGMDLDVRENGVWTMAGAARPGLQDRHASTIVEHMDGQPKECMLYLPAWSELLTLEIGVDEGASVTPLESPYKHRVIVFGSSVTHGASASRPGMTYPARMSRMTGIEFVNLGYSGNCMLQPEFARLLAETDADAFLFDAFSNPSPKMIRERLDAFVATLVKAHPDKPLIFMQTHWHRWQPRSGGREIPPRADRHRGRDDAAAGEAIRQRLLPRRRMVLRPGRRGNHRLRPRFRPGLRPHDLGAAAPYPEDPAQIRNPVVRAHCAGFRSPATESLRFQRGDFLRISRLQKIFALFDWCCLPLFGRQSSLNRGVCRGGFVPFGGKRYPKPSACRFRGNVVWHR